MAPPSIYQAAQNIDRLLVSCAEATDSLKQLSGGDDSTHIPKNELWEIFPVIERHLLYAFTLLLGRNDPLRQPFRSLLEESWIDTILRCCSNTLFIIHYNLRSVKRKTSDADVNWDEARELLVVQDKNLKHLTEVLKIHSDSKLPSLHVLNGIDKQASRSSQIRQKIKGTGTATPAAKGMLGKTAHVSDADLAQAATPSEPSEPFPPKGKQENTNNISERDDGNSRGTEYDRGFKDGREQACSLLKSIGLFDFEPPNGNRVTWLTQAILEDSVQAVELLLDMGTEINQESPLEDSKGYHITASLLLERGANIDGRSSSGWNVLHAAAKGGDVPTIQLLWEEYNVGIEVRSDGNADKGFTPLIIAVKHGEAAAVRYLKLSKANLKTTDDTGQSLLHLAVNREDLKTVQLLVELGVQTGVVDDNRRFLIKETPGLVNSENQVKETPLHCAAKAGRVNILELLIENGARVDLPNNTGRTPLHLAVVFDDVDAVALLLKNNARLDARTNSGNAPLHAAIWSKKNSMITLLLDNGADINQVGQHGMPPLHIAAKIQDFATVYELLKRGASPWTGVKIKGKGEEQTAKGVLLAIAQAKRGPDFQRINKLLSDALSRRTILEAAQYQ